MTESTSQALIKKSGFAYKLSSRVCHFMKLLIRLVTLGWFLFLMPVYINTLWSKTQRMSDHSFPYLTPSQQSVG